MWNVTSRMEVRVTIFQIRRCENSGRMRLCTLLWEQSRADNQSLWSLPGGWLRDDENIQESAERQLSEKVDVHSLSHLEQLQVFSQPNRRSDGRVVLCAFMATIPTTSEPQLPDDTHWIPVDALPQTVADHAAVIAAAQDRLVSKLGYTNLGFALSPATFTISELRDIYEAALGYRVDASNLQRTLRRRGVITPTGHFSEPGDEGGRPAKLYAFVHNTCQVTDSSAILRRPQRSDTKHNQQPSF